MPRSLPGGDRRRRRCKVVLRYAYTRSSEQHKLKTGIFLKVEILRTAYNRPFSIHADYLRKNKMHLIILLT